MASAPNPQPYDREGVGFVPVGVPVTRALPFGVCIRAPDFGETPRMVLHRQCSYSTRYLMLQYDIGSHLVLHTCV